MKNTWNIICKDILDKKRKQATEKEYQDLICAHFRYLLGWHSERIETQHQLRVGSTVNFVYPDIVFFKNNDPSFVIEMKKTNHVQNKEEIVQLFSYMKLLPVQFGLYIGEFIELFYYEFSKEPISVLRIDFIEDSFKNDKPMPFHSLAFELYNDFILTGGYPSSIVLFNKRVGF